MKPKQNGGHFAGDISLQMHFLEWKSSYFDSNFTEIRFLGSFDGSTLEKTARQIGDFV